MSYNVHLTGHIIEAVRKFGSLYNFSLFPYESGNFELYTPCNYIHFHNSLGNGMLLGFRTGNASPLVQIERKYNMNKLCHRNYPGNTPPVQNWINSLWSKQQNIVQFDQKLLCILPDNLVFDTDVVERSFNAHGKIQYKRLNLCTKQTCHVYNYDDSWVFMNGQFYSIVEILTDHNNTLYIAGQQLRFENLFHNMHSYELTNIVQVMRVNDTIRQCVSMSIKTNDRTFKFVSKCKIRTQID